MTTADRPQLAHAADIIFSCRSVMKLTTAVINEVQLNQLIDVGLPQRRVMDSTAPRRTLSSDTFEISMVQSTEWWCEPGTSRVNPVIETWCCRFARGPERFELKAATLLDFVVAAES